MTYKHHIFLYQYCLYEKKKNQFFKLFLTEEQDVQCPRAGRVQKLMMSIILYCIILYYDHRYQNFGCGNIVGSFYNHNCDCDKEATSVSETAFL
jgi:hypothetical protein